MMNVTALQAGMPRAPIAWLISILEITPRYAIDTPHEMASFCSQIALESEEFLHLEENLNYSAQGLANTWARFSISGKRGGSPTNQALSIQRKPEVIANIVYSNRYGNGDEASGDGWRYRGQGPIQLTFLDNYRLMEQKIGLPLVDHPEHARIPHIGIEIACIFWKEKGLDAVDDDEDVRAERRKVNGGELGLAKAQAYFNAILKALSA